LVITAENVTIGGSSQYAYLVNIEIEKEREVVNNDKVAVVVKVFLNNPDDESVYQEVKGKSIKFELHFTAQQ
jgi:hypothetical protein